MPDAPDIVLYSKLCRHNPADPNGWLSITDEGNRPKQLSMAASQVIWLCACVRHWLECVTCLYCFFSRSLSPFGVTSVTRAVTFKTWQHFRFFLFHFIYFCYVIALYIAMIYMYVISLLVFCIPYCRQSLFLWYIYHHFPWNPKAKKRPVWPGKKLIYGK